MAALQPQGQSRSGICKLFRTEEFGTATEPDAEGFAASTPPFAKSNGNAPQVPTGTTAGVPESMKTSLVVGAAPGFVIVLVVMICCRALA